MRRRVKPAMRTISWLAVSLSLLQFSQHPQAIAIEQSASLANARELITNGNSEQALKLLKNSKANISENDQSEYYFLIARAHQELGNNPEALEHYSLAIQYNPNSAKALTNRGLVKGALQDVNGALNDLNQSIAIDPKISESHLNLGVTLAALNKPKEALSSFNQALKLNKNYADAYRNRGIVYKHLKQNTRACADWRSSQRIRPSPDIQKWLSAYC